MYVQYETLFSSLCLVQKRGIGMNILSLTYTIWCFPNHHPVIETESVSACSVPKAGAGTSESWQTQNLPRSASDRLKLYRLADWQTISLSDRCAQIVTHEQTSKPQSEQPFDTSSQLRTHVLRASLVANSNI